MSFINLRSDTNGISSANEYLYRRPTGRRQLQRHPYKRSSLLLVRFPLIFQ